MVLAEYHQIQTWLYTYICYLLFEGVLMLFDEELVCLLVGLVINRDNTTPVIYFTKSAFFNSCNILYGKLI